MKDEHAAAQLGGSCTGREAAEAQDGRVGHLRYDRAVGDSNRPPSMSSSSLAVGLWPTSVPIGTGPCESLAELRRRRAALRTLWTQAICSWRSRRLRHAVRPLWLAEPPQREHGLSQQAHSQSRCRSEARPCHVTLVSDAMLQVQRGVCGGDSTRGRAPCDGSGSGSTHHSMLLSSQQVDTFSEPSGLQPTPASLHGWSEASALPQFVVHQRRSLPISPSRM